MSINLYERSHHSQFGEDGIIEEIFNRIGHTDSMFGRKKFVEFGVETGIQSNTYYLASQKGWAGYMIEGNSNMYYQLVQNMHPYAVDCLFSFITKDNIVEIFEKMAVPTEFDLLSIDVDGNDYWVWKALSGYKPRVIVIEYNPYYVPPRKWVMGYDENHSWDQTTHQGASLTSLALLGKSMGYALVGTENMGNNCFFIRDDLVEKSGFPELTPEQAYKPAAYRNPNNPHGNGHLYREGPHEEI